MEDTDRFIAIAEWDSENGGRRLDASGVSGGRFTLHARIRLPGDGSSRSLLSNCDNGGRSLFRLYTRLVEPDSAGAEWDDLRQNYLPYTRRNSGILECEIRLPVPEMLLEAKRAPHERKRAANPDLPPFVPHPDLAAGIMRIGFPLSMAGSTDTISVTVRVSGVHFELFVDGVLVDEEWPIGTLQLGRDGLAVEPDAVECCSLWNRVLPDEELTRICGGSDAVARRRAEILGPEPAGLQYWAPRGFNCWAGDPMCFFHEGRFHLFYLFDRRHHTSKWHTGGHQFAHLSTTDLRNWEHHPMAVPIEEDWLSCGTGGCVHHEGRYYVFYGMHTGRMTPLTTGPLQERDLAADGTFKPISFDTEEGSPSGTARATSEDGVRFTKERLVVTPTENMFVFKDASRNVFHMIESGKARYLSEDLLHWKVDDTEFLPVFAESPTGNTDECPCYFEWNGWHYIIMGRSGFWMSRSATGPYWKSPSCAGPVCTPRWDIYEGLVVPQVAAFTDNRRILCGFLWGRSPAGKTQYAGHLVFRELIQYEDGTLGMKWPEEMIPAFGEPLAISPCRLPEGAGYRNGSAALRAPGSGFQYVCLGDLPGSCRISMRVSGHEGAESFGVCVMGSEDYEGGCELQFDRSRDCVQWGTPVGGRPAKAVPIVSKPRSPFAPHNGADFALAGVDVFGAAFHLDIILKQDWKSASTIVDACIDRRRTLITRRRDLPGRLLCLFVKGGEAAYGDITVLPDGPAWPRF